MGVAAALRAYLPNMRFSVVCGASAGALAGVSLLGDVPPGETYSVPQYKGRGIKKWTASLEPQT